MRFIHATFEKSTTQRIHFPEPTLPEVVFVGRSNVGKSSLLNALTTKANLARVSKTPGKTQQVNFYLIDDKIRFVDCPGYGFARVGHAEREAWARSIETYFSAKRPIALVLQLLDARIPLQDLDARMLAWLASKQLPVHLVLTKADKLTQKERARQEKFLVQAVRTLGCEAQATLVSSVTGLGKASLIATISTTALRPPSPEITPP